MIYAFTIHYMVHRVRFTCEKIVTCAHQHALMSLIYLLLSHVNRRIYINIEVTDYLHIYLYELMHPRHWHYYFLPILIYYILSCCINIVKNLCKHINIKKKNVENSAKLLITFSNHTKYLPWQVSLLCASSVRKYLFLPTRSIVSYCLK